MSRPVFAAGVAAAAFVLVSSGPSCQPFSSETSEAPREGGPTTADAGGACTGENFAGDRQNCGRCGHDCLGGDCVSGRCQPRLIGTVAEPFYFAVDQDSLYVGSYGSGSSGGGLFRVPKGGGPAKTLVQAPTRVFGVAVHGDDVVYCAIADGNVIRIKKDGTAPTTLATGGCVEVTVAANGDVFFTTGRDQVGRVAEGQTTPTFLLPPGVVQGQSEGLAVDGTDMFVADSAHVFRFDSAGGGGVKMDGGLTPRRLVLDQDHAYWTDLNGPQIWRTARASTSPEAVGSGFSATGPGSLAVDEHDVYWVTSLPKIGGIYRAPKDGSGVGVASEVVATSLDQPVDLALDGEAVYFTIQGSSQVMVVAKP